MTRRLVLVTLLLTLGVGGAASAIDLTGTWSNVKSFSCTSTTPAGATKDNYTSSALDIAQSAGVLAIEVGTGNAWTGRVIENAKGIGLGVAHYCGVSGAVATYTILSASTFPVDANGVSGRLRVSYRFVSTTQVLDCKKVEFVRTNTADPSPMACP